MSKSSERFVDAPKRATGRIEARSVRGAFQIRSADARVPAATRSDTSSKSGKAVKG